MAIIRKVKTMVYTPRNGTCLSNKKNLSITRVCLLGYRVSRALPSILNTFFQAILAATWE